MIFVSLAAACLLQWFLFRRRPIVDPCWVLFLIFVYYAYFVPIAMVLSGDYGIYLVAQPIFVNSPDLQQATIVSLLGFAGLAIGYWLATRRAAVGGAPRDPKPTFLLFQESAALRVFTVAIILVAGLILLPFSGQLGATLSSYADKIETNYDNSVFSFVMGVGLMLISIVLNYLILSSRTSYVIGVFGVAFFVAVSLLVFSKQPLIFALLAGVCLLARQVKISPFAVTLAIATAAIVILVYLAPVYAAYRGTGEIDFALSKGASAGAISSDALGPFGVLVYAFNGYVNADGHPIWQSFVIWIPRALWPDRPLDLSEDFARQIIVGWRPGFGVAFSPLAEAYVRVGMLGTPVFMALFGGLIGLFQNLAARFVPADARAAVTITVTSTLALATLRGPLSSVITQGLQIVAPISLVGIAALFFHRRQIGLAGLASR